MEQIKCPLCDGSCWVIAERDWFNVLGPVITLHTPSPRAVLDGRDVRHIGSSICLAAGAERSFAEGIAADRRAGVHLRSHP